MSRRKHILQSLNAATEAPAEGQSLVRALGTRGGNIVEVEYPDGRSTLCMLPAKFNKKIWVKRGGYLIVQEGEVDGDAKVTATIVQVLYEDQVKQLKRMPGVWPSEFNDTARQHHADGGHKEAAVRDGDDINDDDADEDDEDDNDPLMQHRSNRQVIEYVVHDSDSD